MDSDTYLVLGLLLLALAFPSLLSAFSESRAPRLALMLAVMAGILIVIAVRDRPSGYSIEEIPSAVFRVIGRLLN